MQHGNSHQSYDPTYFAQLFEIEDRHFWFRARNRIISILTKQILPRETQNARILEIGCGTGNVLRVLEQACTNGTLIGVDLFAQGLRYAKQRTSCPLVLGDMHCLPFNRSFDLIGVFDVLEHMPDDDCLLQYAGSLLKPGGKLLLTVPAHPSLWSYFDIASHHCRRYKPTELETRLVSAGLQVEYITQYMACIFPAVWLGRRIAKVVRQYLSATTASPYDLALRELHITPILNEVLAFVLGLESHVIARGGRLPIGTSLIAVGRKDSA